MKERERKRKVTTISIRGLRYQLDTSRLSRLICEVMDIAVAKFLGKQ